MVKGAIQTDRGLLTNVLQKWLNTYEALPKKEFIKFNIAFHFSFIEVICEFHIFYLTRLLFALFKCPSSYLVMCIVSYNEDKVVYVCLIENLDKWYLCSKGWLHLLYIAFKKGDKVCLWSWQKYFWLLRIM